MTIAQSYTADDKQDLNPAHLSRSVISVTPQNFPLSPVLFMPKWQTIQVLPERTWQVCPFFHIKGIMWATNLGHGGSPCLMSNPSPPGVQFGHSVVSNSATPWTAAHQASLSITNSQSLLKLLSIMSVMPSNHLILCRPLLLQPLIFPSIRVFSNESVLCIRWPKYWGFSFSISPSNE